MIEPKHFAEVAKALIENNAYQAVKYISPSLTVKGTRQFKYTSRNTRNGFVFTAGRPSVREREFIKKAVKAGEPFPIKKPQLRFKTYKAKA